ncbi:MAG: hypothetical protein JSV00_01605 [bacterium]|nr:MAG: hypothetical protein JSV00_01605 [bacterium]
MKNKALRYALLCVLTVSWTLALFPGPRPGLAGVKAEAGKADRVVIYQFHRRFRCQECVNLENTIRETLQTHFPEDLKSGRVVFTVLDLDKEGNEHYEKDYDFFYNTVIMVDVRGNREVRFKNLEQVWKLWDQKGALMEFVRSELDAYLKGL